MVLDWSKRGGGGGEGREGGKCVNITRFLGRMRQSCLCLLLLLLLLTCQCWWQWYARRDGRGMLMLRAVIFAITPLRVD